MSDGPAGGRERGHAGEEALRIVIAGGGTGGHLFPGVAVAHEVLRRVPAAVVTFAGTAHGIEARVVPREGFALDTIRSLGLKGKSLAARLRGLVMLPLSASDAWRVLTVRRPHVVLGVGGYSSGPVVAIASLRRIPTLLHEQNAQPGLTNRLLAGVVRAVAVTFEDSAAQFGEKAFVSGNPVRPQFLQVSDDTAGVRKVLVFGGSQGAHAINLAMVEAAPRLARAQPAPVITHQTGRADLELVREGYRRAGLAARVEPFIEDMAGEMSAASLIVSRAGSTTLAEIAAVGRAALLVPLPTATDDHQRRNAAALVRAGAAEMLEQRDMTGEWLAARIIALLADGPRRHAMARAGHALAKPKAASVIVDRMLDLASMPPRGGAGALKGTA